MEKRIRGRLFFLGLAPKTRIISYIPLDGALREWCGSISRFIFIPIWIPLMGYADYSEVECGIIVQRPSGRKCSWRVWLTHGGMHLMNGAKASWPMALAVRESTLFIHDLFLWLLLVLHAECRDWTPDSPSYVGLKSYRVVIFLNIGAVPWHRQIFVVIALKLFDWVIRGVLSNRENIRNYLHPGMGLFDRLM